MRRSSAVLQPGVVPVAQPVAEQVEPEHGQGDRDAGVDREARRGEQQLLALLQHPAPRRGRRRGAEPEEGQRRLGQDGDGERHRGLHDHEAADVRQHVPHGDRHRAPAGRPGGQDVLGAHHLQRPAAHDPREAGHGGDADRDHRGERAGAEDRAEHDRQQQGREREQQVVGAHHDLAEPARRHRREDAERHPDHGGHAHRDEPHEQRRPRAHDDLAEDVTAELVGAEPVLRRGGEQPRASGRPASGRTASRRRRPAPWRRRAARAGPPTTRLGLSRRPDRRPTPGSSIEGLGGAHCTPPRSRGSRAR